MSIYRDCLGRTGDALTPRWTAAAAWLKDREFAERLIRRNPWLYSLAKRQLVGLHALPADVRHAWTERRLRAVLRAAAATRYGREVSGGDSLSTWPLLGRDQLRDDPRAFSGGLRWLGAPASSGGTTGTPVRLLRSAMSVVVEQVCLDLLLQRVGGNPKHAKVAVLRGDFIKDPSDHRPPFWRYTLGGRRLVLSSNHLSPASIDAFADNLRAFEPDVLCGYPTALESLCQLLRVANLRVAVRYVVTSSEVLSPHAWEIIGETLCATVVDYYGQAERVALAHALRPREYRFVPGYAHVELVRLADDDTDSLYEIVGTPLWNRAMPLVRYRTGDVVRLPREWGDREVGEVCCGVRPFGGVLGRDGDVLLSPEGMRLTGIDHFPREVEHVQRIQVVQETLTKVRIWVIPGTGYSVAHAEELLRNSRRKLPATMSVTVEEVDRLERTPAGKTPFIIHRPAVRAMLRGLPVRAPGPTD